ncbi:MAG: arylformamidase [Planctomycetota bacterium]|jgi:arylformamidase
MKVYDISEPISEQTAVFPGDTPFSREWLMRMEEGHSCNVSTIQMSAHCGTHSDSPLHYASEDPDIASVDLSKYMGRCRVLAVTGEGDPSLVPRSALSTEILDGVKRLLLRTSDRHDHRVFDRNFTALGPAAAKAVVTAGLQLVGIDTPSMDHPESKELEAHKILRSGGVALLENLDLTGVPEGDYELIALPLRIIDSDSSPVRAILREL